MNNVILSTLMTKRRVFVLFLLAIFLTFNANAQTLTASVNRSNVPQGETFIFTLDLSDAKTNSPNSPDFSILDDNFKTYSVSKSYRSINQNGVKSTQQQWQVVLAPLKVGEIMIPSINFEGMSSQPVKISVTEASLDVSSANNDVPKFSIDGVVENSAPYVQQQVNYVMTIYDSGGLQGDAPIIKDNGDWIIHILKQPTVEIKDNIREIKFYYALFPQKSGVLKTPEIQFNGFYITEGKGEADPFIQAFGRALRIDTSFAQRNPITLSPKQIEINVKPIPANNKSWWLPAQNVILEDKWEPENPKFAVGEAVTRNIYLKTTGVMENQLPELYLPQVEHIKQYPEKAKTHNIVEDNQVISVSEITNLYIPNSGGELILPEISVDWFNVNTGKTEKATLPEVKINVAGEVFKEPVFEAISEEEIPAEKEKSNILPIIFAVFVLGILFAYLLFKPSSKNYKKEVIIAAKTGDAKKLRDALLEWAKTHYKNENIGNLQDIADISGNKEFAQKLNKLTLIIYSNKKTGFDADAFMNIFNRVNKKKVKNKDLKQPLPKLYD